MVAGAEEEKFVYKKVWLGDETDGNVVATWNREMSACVRTCLCAQVCACVHAHIKCISECGGAGTGGGSCFQIYFVFG